MFALLRADCEENYAQFGDFMTALGATIAATILGCCAFAAWVRIVPPGLPKPPADWWDEGWEDRAP